MISDLDVRNALTNRLYDSSSLVPENDRESAFRVISRELHESAYQPLCQSRNQQPLNQRTVKTSCKTASVRSLGEDLSGLTVWQRPVKRTLMRTSSF